MVVEATILISGWVPLAVDLELQEPSNMEPNAISSPNANLIFVMDVNDGLLIVGLSQLERDWGCVGVRRTPTHPSSSLNCVTSKLKTVFIVVGPGIEVKKGDPQGDKYPTEIVMFAIRHFEVFFL